MLTVAAWGTTDNLKPDTLLPSLVPTTIDLTELPIMATAPNESPNPDEKLEPIQTTSIVSKYFDITAKNRPKARSSSLEVRIARTSLSKFLSEQLGPFRPV